MGRYSLLPSDATIFCSACIREDVWKWMCGRWVYVCVFYVCVCACVCVCVCVCVCGCGYIWVCTFSVCSCILEYDHADVLPATELVIPRDDTW